MLKLITIFQLFLPKPPRKKITTPDLMGFATYRDLGTIRSDPWAGWVLHEHPRNES